jgi:hypothetical protein
MVQEEIVAPSARASGGGGGAAAEKAAADANVVILREYKTLCVWQDYCVMIHLNLWDITHFMTDFSMHFKGACRDKGCGRSKCKSRGRGYGCCREGSSREGGC